jgi:hypothetical protein
MEYEAGSIKNSIDARHYATLLCADRIMHNHHQFHDDAVNPTMAIAHLIYLDSIKRVMEIDETIDNPLDALLRAGVAMVNEEEPS